MIASAKQWEGRLAGEKFRLGRWLGGSDHSAIFLVERRGGDQSQTAIRFVDAKSEEAGDQLKRWEAASKLEHPDLIQIFETGRCQIAGNDLLYALTECADEDLSQILPERALTVEEVREVLEATLSALAYVHSKGLVHGRLRPSNIMAVSNDVKVSSNSLRPAGKLLLRRSAYTAYDAPEVADGIFAPAADVWSLGVTLVEVLTRRLPVFDLQLKEPPLLPEGIPQPFQEIIENCLRIDPAARWTVAQIMARLRGAQPEAGAFRPAAASSPPGETGPVPLSTLADQKRSAWWPYAIVLIAAIVVVVLVARRSPPASHPPTETASANAAAEKAAAPGASAAASTAAGPRQAGGQVAERITPSIAHSAQASIQGRVRVQVMVDVDETGKVREASLRSPGPSRYFARQALEAAREWRFKAPLEDGQPIASQWLVRFTFSRHGIDESAEQIRP